MKHYEIERTISSKVSHSSIPLKNLVETDNKVCRLEKLINWKYLDRELAHLFESENAPSPRLIFGLLYLQSVDNLPYSDIMAIWEKSPEWQYFCGEEFLIDTFPLHPAALSIWSRVIGTQGRQLMTQALGSAKHNVTLH